MYARYRQLCAHPGRAGGLLDEEGFRAALPAMARPLTRRTFALLDADADGYISFVEFVVGVSVFSRRASPKEKARFSFRIFDAAGDGVIDAAELCAMLRAVLSGVATPSPGGGGGERAPAALLGPEQIEAIARQTFADAGVATAGAMSASEFESLVAKRPRMIRFMTVADSDLPGSDGIRGQLRG